LTKSRAVWVSRDVVAWKVSVAAGHAYSLRYSTAADIVVDPAGGIARGSTLRLDPLAGGLAADLRAKFPHLSEYAAFRVRAGDLARVPSALTGQVVAVDRDAEGALRAATGVQLAGVLDDLYAGAWTLGPQVRGSRATVALWAPTAQSVRLRLFGTAPSGAPTLVPLRRDARSGVWSAAGNWAGRYYQYEVKVYAPSTRRIETNVVTDPYSIALAANSTHSLLADLSGVAPAGWSSLRKPGLDKHTLYELHVRDFSIGDSSVPPAWRGTYKAFTAPGSDGMKHLRGLAQAGLTTVHLLPTFDIATIGERRSDHEQPDCDLPSLPPDSEEQQACVGRVADADGFNWGYDPYHYNAPEGSYATSPDGVVRTREYREMVAALSRAGLRVVADVVYNHTTAAGQDSRSVLDRVLPGYYQRLDADGAITTSTCCANTAPENAMMGKLVVDSVVHWARTYKIDGFRFDLMGHHPKANILAVRRALDALTLARDGVDGRKILLYGEGWNFGEVAGGARFVQATQANMAGTGVATFTDRLRDAVRGGGPFDDDPRIQGFGSGLFTDPNASPANGDAAAQKARLLHYQDLIKLGLAGNLRDYQFVDSNGRRVRGSEVDYNGSPAGYAAQPREVITYVDAHDNEALYDALAYKLPPATAMASRVRMQQVGLATAFLGQGRPFVHAGTEMLRSKSLDRNSYNSGDWFNRLDFTYRSNGFGSGLPPAADNAPKWAYARPLLGSAALRPASSDIVGSRDRTAEWLRIRDSSPLFDLGTAELVQQKVSFPAGAPGVIVMRIDDTAGPDVDPALAGLVVVFNATGTAQTVDAPGTLALHPVQAGGTDPVVKQTSVSGGRVTVPARTVAVFTAR
jgi:pullulanase